MVTPYFKHYLKKNTTDAILTIFACISYDTFFNGTIVTGCWYLENFDTKKNKNIQNIKFFKIINYLKLSFY